MPNMAVSLPDTMCSLQLCDKALAGLQQLLYDLHNLLEDHDTADVVFLLDREEERIPAHKIILMTR